MCSTLASSLCLPALPSPLIPQNPHDPRTHKDAGARLVCVSSANSSLQISQVWMRKIKRRTQDLTLLFWHKEQSSETSQTTALGLWKTASKSVSRFNQDRNLRRSSLVLHCRVISAKWECLDSPVACNLLIWFSLIFSAPVVLLLSCLCESSGLASG